MQFAMSATEVEDELAVDEDPQVIITNEFEGFFAVVDKVGRDVGGEVEVMLNAEGVAARVAKTTKVNGVPLVVVLRELVVAVVLAIGTRSVDPVEDERVDVLASGEVEGRGELGVHALNVAIPLVEVVGVRELDTTISILVVRGVVPDREAVSTEGGQDSALNTTA